MTSHQSPMDELEVQILQFGKEIFKAIGDEQPSAFNKNYWSGLIMDWSMTKPEFKLNMFRLVDVLPSLRNSRAIAQHVSEYLGSVGAEIGGKLADWGLNVNPTSIRAKITSALVKRSVEQMASQFIAGETPSEAIPNLKKLRQKGLCFTVDLLGEYSVSEREATDYLQRYLDILDTLGTSVPNWRVAPLVTDHPGERSAINVSVKLSALYSQCHALNFERSVDILSERLASIARKAKEIGASIYVDAEDVGHNPIIYATFKRVFGSQEFINFAYPGIVLQGYAKDSSDTLQDLLHFARERSNPIAVRLVKGAYWDAEAAACSQNHWENPLFSRKEHTDANYEQLSKVLIDNYEVCLPAFGSHNIRSLSFACLYAEQQGLTTKDFELQMLYGMAEPIARSYAARGYLVRMYVPIGAMLPGMGYLVRRLLENTSNESFLRHTFFDASDIERLLAKPSSLQVPLNSTASIHKEIHEQSNLH